MNKYFSKQEVEYYYEIPIKNLIFLSINFQKFYMHFQEFNLKVIDINLIKNCKPRIY